MPHRLWPASFRLCLRPPQWLGSPEQGDRRVNRAEAHLHSGETDRACWPNRGSAESAEVFRHCVLNTHGTRAMSWTVDLRWPLKKTSHLRFIRHRWPACNSIPDTNRCTGRVTTFGILWSSNVVRFGERPPKNYPSGV